MAGVTELWFVRLPDGRVVRVKSTRALRYHLQTGRISRRSHFRRAAFEDWEGLEAFAELADVNGQRPPSVDVPRPPSALSASGAPSTPSAGNDLHAAGVRGLTGDLLKALESSLHRTKVKFAAGLGLFLGLAAPTPELLSFLTQPYASILPAASGLAMLFLVSLVSALLSQMTLIELSRLRAARRREVMVGLGKYTFRLTVGLALIGGLVVGLIAVLRHLPGWISPGPGPGHFPEELAAIFVVARTFLEVLIWPILGLALLLAPILVVEECSLLWALRHWWNLLRKHLGRLLVYEGLAVTLGVLITLPFILPVVIASWAAAPAGDLVATVRLFTLTGLGGLALTPLITYLLVANVFIYLHLRYEFSPR